MYEQQEYMLSVMNRFIALGISISPSDFYANTGYNQAWGFASAVQAAISGMSTGNGVSHDPQLVAVPVVHTNADGSTSYAPMAVIGMIDADGQVHVVPLGSPIFGGGDVASAGNDRVAVGLGELISAYKAAGLDPDWRVSGAVERRWKRYFSQDNEATGVARKLTKDTLAEGKELKLLRVYLSLLGDRVSLEGNPTPGNPYSTDVPRPTPGFGETLVVELHPHFSSSEVYPSVSDLLMSARDGVPGVIMLRTSQGWDMIVYQGRFAKNPDE